MLFVFVSGPYMPLTVVGLLFDRVDRHGSIRNSADVDAVDGGVNRDVEGLGAGNEFPHEKAKQHLHLVGSPGVVALVRAIGENPQPFADLVHSGWG